MGGDIEEIPRPENSEIGLPVSTDLIDKGEVVGVLHRVYGPAQHPCLTGLNGDVIEREFRPIAIRLRLKLEPGNGVLGEKPDLALALGDKHRGIFGHEALDLR